MSQRLGMADGRCFTIGTASRLLNDHVMKTNNIGYSDNYSYRQLLQKMGPDVMDSIEDKQRVGQIARPNNYINQCQSCNVPLLKVPDTY
tara:strand:+ start:5397 stop:5663 length:267 start_codon:yes stop_codon:yes gene_type:complete